MTVDEIVERVKLAPQLACRLYVHPNKREQIIAVAESVSGLDWHGVTILINPMLPTEAMVWTDRNDVILLVQMPDAIDATAN